MKIRDLNIGALDVTLWLEDSKLNFKSGKKAKRKEYGEFVRANEAFIKEFISDRSQEKIRILSMAYNQKALWFHHQINPGNVSYNVAVSGKSNSGINVEILRKSLEMLSERHIMLRTVFAGMKGKFNTCQIILDSVEPYIEEIDAEKLSSLQLDKLIKEKYSIPFDLSGGPLFKTYIFRKEDTSYFLFNIHHIICDAWSLKIFVRELFEYYDAIIKGEHPKPDSVIFDYSDFVLEQKDFIMGKKGLNQMSFWSKKLTDKTKPLILPYDFERPDIQTFNGSTFHFSISGDLFSKLNEVAGNENVTPNVILYTLYELLLSKLSGQKQFVIGVPSTSRTKPEHSGVFGYLINMLPVDCNLEENKKLTEYLHENKNKLNSAIENQGIPFPLIVELVSPNRDPSKPLVFQAMYNFMNRRTIGSLMDIWKPADDKYKKFGALEIASYPIDDQEGQFDITFEILHNIDEFACVFKYNTDLFKQETIKKFESEFRKLLDDLISDPDNIPEWMTESKTDAEDESKTTVNITGTFTIEPLSPYLTFWMDRLGINSQVEYPGYNQVFQQLLNPASEFNVNNEGINLAIVRFEDIFTKEIESGDHANISVRANELSDAIDFASGINPKGKYIVAFCPPSDNVKSNAEINTLFEELEADLINKHKGLGNVYFISSGYTVEAYFVTNYYEPLGEKQGHIPFKDDFFASLATLIARKINALYILPVKAIAVDCDNTLWKGIVGEDGYNGIRIEETELAIQQFLIEQHSEGVIITLCSKNNENDVFEVFEKNNNMLLKKEHISFHRINWMPKSQNLISLSEEINIGIDSFVFIDDNPAECDEVRQNLPQVITIQKPENDNKANFLRNSWAFDKVKVTEEDKVRSKRYKDESDRKKYRSAFDSYKDFIDGLEIKIDIDSFQDDEIPRISQLSFRTNQFNFTTIRRDEASMMKLAKDSGHECFQVKVSDRFGEYGLTGVIIADKNKGYVIDTFMLSCRVLGKGVEHKLIQYLGERAKESGAENLVIRLIKSKKNAPAQLFLNQNFEQYKSEDGEAIIYSVPVDDAVNFSFAPANVTETEETVEASKPKDLPTDKNIEKRNFFYNSVIENYLDIEKIKGEVKRQTRKTAPKSQKVSSDSNTTNIVSEVWKEVLNIESIGLDDNFFDIGGHSVLIPQMVIDLETKHNIKIKIVDVFQYPSIRKLTEFIESKSEGGVKAQIPDQSEDKIVSDDIAVIGIAGRFPGAENIDQFWDLITSGREGTSYYTREELEAKNVSATLLDDKNYVYANGLLESADKFDSTFFGYTPREADFMDPQHRIFLEVCYEALESAGYRNEKGEHSIGVFGGCGMNNYLVKNLVQHQESLHSFGEFQTILNNSSDHLTTRVSYKLNLKGPSMDVQTACSTSMVAVHVACRSLINNECYMALGGGAFMPIPHNEGYMFEQGGIFSRDGHCRPFDKDSDGTLFGSGAGVVVLKRLDDAIKDNDTIMAVIKGTAINNDGSQKVGYMAPSVQGQSDVIMMALNKTGINPETISYLEAHGTGTKMGDPIEISALTQTYRKFTQKENYCAIGSIKANTGHLDAASGITGLIKTILLLKNKKLPPLTNFKEPNPELYLETSPFYVNTELRDWINDSDLPRRAAVSSFGMGGTNSHCILEEAPEVSGSASSEISHLLPVSAKNKKALSNQMINLNEHLKSSDDELADIAFTLQRGRDFFTQRSVLIARSKEDAINSLEKSDEFLVNGSIQVSNPRVAFMFTGQGSQYTGMARDLYNDFEVFRNIINGAHDLLSAKYDIDVLKYILNEKEEDLSEELNQTSIAQVLLFTIQYSTAKLLEKFGISPDALIGHSIGELTAACIAGVFSFEDGLEIVAERGRIMQKQKPGAMLSVQMTADDLKPLINGNIEISLYNSPGFTVVSGTFDAIDFLAEKIKKEKPGVFTTKLKTSHAFHSYLIEPAVKEFIDKIKNFDFHEPVIPVISNTTGTWAKKEELIDPDYWGNHIRSAVNFKDGMNELLKDENSYFIEVGPGNSLSVLQSQFKGYNAGKVTSTIRHIKENANDSTFFLRAVAKSWVSGVNIDWSAYYNDENRKRVPLPTYPFEKIHHWIHPLKSYVGKDNAILEDTVAIDDVSGIVESKTLYHNRPSLDNEFVAAKSDLELKVAAIWEELLGINGIGVTDDFFLLGGHSLLASQIINRINEEFNAEITLDKFFNYPTIRGLIENEAFSADSAKKAVQEKLDLNYSSYLPLSPSQKRLWIINQIDDNNPAYNISFSYLLKGELNRNIFQQSLELLFDRHKVLKSYIRERDGIPVAYINSEVSIPVEEIDFTDSSKEELDDRIQKFLEHESRMSFDIQRGPLYRMYLINLGKGSVLFQFTVHHLVFDGWSWGVFTKEFREIYNDLLSGNEVHYNDLEIDYFEYSELMNREIPDESHFDLQKYWKQKLEGISGHLNFPFDYKRKEIPSGKGERVPLDFGKAKSEIFREFSKEHNVTLYMFLLSAFGVILNRYTGDRDICIGSPTANRQSSKYEKLIGLFINSIVMRLQIDEDKTFLQLLNEVKKISIEALSHQNLAFEELVEVLNPERIPNINPVFQVMFALQNAPRPPLDLNGIHSERMFHQRGVSPLDISYYAWEDEGDILGEIEFSTDIFKQKTIQSFKDNFACLLDNIIENPEVPLKNLSILSPTEQKRIHLFNSTNASVKPIPVHSFFEKNVAAFADKTAVESASGLLSYSELDQKANKLAHYLIDKGFKPENIAGISMTRSYSMLVVVLGVLKAGGCYLPLDPAFPDERLHYMLEDSGAGFLITENSLFERYSQVDVNKIIYDSELDEIEKCKPNNPGINIDPDSLAYIIYTSGSTGKPKGVKVHHLAVTNFIKSMSQVPGLIAEDRLLAVTTLSFDISVLEIFLPISQGAYVYIADSEDIADGESLIRIIEEKNITVLQATPATWEVIIGSGWKGKKDLKALCGGEALQSHVAKELLPKVEVLWNMYGPTETTVWSSCQIITDYNNITVGKPINNTGFHILHFDQEQPVGVVGEVCISGDGVTKGYHNREELTKEKFYNWNGITIYRTGDLGRILDDETIELLGRTDNQIKLRGYRIEPGEIEFQLSQIEGVKEAVVKLENFGPQDDRLVGYLNVYESFVFDQDKVVKSIEDKIPQYMIPSSFMVMNEFPRTLNGKIDRKALVFDITSISDESVKEDEVLTDTEMALAELWKNILRVKTVRKNKSFFDIGGNSLLAIRLMNKVKETFGVSLTFNILLGNATINKLGEYLDKESSTVAGGIELVHLDSGKNLPLTVNQKRLWLISKLQPDVPTYIIQYSYKLNGEVDPDLLEKSFNLLFHRHHTIHSVIKESNGEPYCDIVEKNVVISSLDYSGHSAAESRAMVEELIDKDSRQAFDLERGPLYRIYLIKTGTAEYYFHFSVHHVIFDGWSWSVLVKELQNIYNSLLKGDDVKLENIEFLQYDYANWETNYSNVENENELVKFWQDNLTGSSPALNFPYDFHRKERPSGRGGCETIKLSVELSDKLRKLSKSEDVSLFTTLLGAFGVQMHKYSGDYDLNIGLPVAHRPHSKLEDIFGMFVNTVVVRLQYDDESTFREIVRNTNKSAQDSINHQDLSFETIVEVVKPERFTNTNPLFQVGFVWQNDLDLPMEFEGVKGERIIGNERTLIFDITLYLWENDGRIEGELEFNHDLLKRDTVIRIRDNYIYLLQSLVDNSDKRLSDISVVSENDKKKIEEFNNTKAPVPNCLIQDFFEKQVVLNSDKNAVSSDNLKLTYTELNNRANQLAWHLLSLGLNAGEVVGICINRSVEMVISALGVLKAGCSFLPMDPSFPDDRIKYMFEDSKAKALISSSSLEQKLKYFRDTQIILMDSDAGKLDEYSTDNPEIRITPKSIAYTIYTSGSTGKPKGVKVHHEALVNLIESMSQKPGISSDDTLLAVVTLSFDMSMYELFVPLSNGASIFIASSQATTDGSVLKNLIEEQNITVLQATPSFWNILLASGWQGKKDIKALCGGEAMNYSLVRQMLPKVKEFWNCYGPTETTVYSTCTQVKDPDAQILIGKPINNTNVYIIDKNNRLLPVGVVGEVAIGGLGVSMGYNKLPELTSEKFIQFETDEVVYKTGDLGRYLDDGNIELLGRSDNQIKLRGFRIEPGEIESIISTLPNVREAVVKIHQFEDGDERLVAFLNIDNEYDMTKDEVISYLSNSVPSYMVPHFIQVSDGFPRTPNGKIDKKALALKLDKPSDKKKTTFDSLPETQKALIVLWKENLKVSDIEPDDNYFDLGGNSLLAIRLMNKVKEEFGVNLTFNILLGNPTVRQLGVYLEKESSSTVSKVELVHLDSMKNLPLTVNQKRLWLISKLQPDVATYIIQYSYKFTGGVNKDLLEKSFNLLFHRHHIIHSVIKEWKGEPYCDIVEKDVFITSLDYSGHSTEKSRSMVEELIVNDSQQVYDLENGPLYRIFLIKTGDSEYYFHFSVHHIVFDGWSWPVLVRELQDIYNGLLKGEEVQLEEIEFQQYDYANWEKSYSDAEHENNLIKFWQDTLTGSSPALNFPYDFHRKERPSGRGGCEKIKLSEELSDKLRKLSKSEDVSLFTTLLGVYGVHMHKYSGDLDLNIGLPVAHRPHSKLEDIFGMFVNTVVVRLLYEDKLTFRDIVRNTSDAAQGSINHGDLSFETVVEVVKPERFSNTNPLFQVAFVWQNNLDLPLELDGVETEKMSTPERTTPFDITLYLWENGKTIEGEIEYATDLLKRDTIKRFINNLIVLFEELSDNPDVPVNSIEAVAKEDKILIESFNNTTTDYPKDKSIVQLFNEQVALYPDKTAVVFKEDSLTYKELNERTNQLARTLLSNGVENGTPVGILVEKSLTMIVGILGILKAGGFYVPIDPDYPEQRMNYMINDSSCRIVLTQDKFTELKFEGIKMMSLDSPDSFHKDKSDVNLKIDSSSLAYIMYTSGTTGMPKGSMIAHYSIVRLVRNTNYIELTPNDRILLTGAIVFDATTFEIWGSLLNGGTLFVVEKETILDPKALGKELLDNNITILWLTAPLFTQIAEKRTDIFSKLKYLLSGGDVLSAPHINKVRRDNPELKVINGYGPTENTTFSTTYLIDKEYDQNIPIGKPISNSTAYILDNSMNYKPIGVIGELYVGGDGLSKGYLNRDDLNKKSFVDNLFSQGAILYKTGDYARWLPDGNIEFHGRIDNQLKIRGFRVELEEIESVISDIDGVVETVVKPIKVQEGDIRLAAFLNVSAGFNIDEGSIGNIIRDKLPPYMIPSAFKMMHGFPKTINGKTDKAALLIDENEFKTGEKKYIEEELTPTQLRIYNIWSKALKTKDISVSDNFFQIGGNSLLAVSVFSDIGSEFGIDIGLRVFFDSPRIKDLADVIDVEMGKTTLEKSEVVKIDNSKKMIKGEI